MNDLLARILRELPDTDRSRYDIAYERGRAQARTQLLAGGLVVGAIAGATAMFFLDPVRGIIDCRLPRATEVHPARPAAQVVGRRARHADTPARFFHYARFGERLDEGHLAFCCPTIVAVADGDGSEWGGERHARTAPGSFALVTGI